MHKMQKIQKKNKEKNKQENNVEKVGLTEEEKAAKLKPYFFNSKS